VHIILFKPPRDYKLKSLSYGAKVNSLSFASSNRARGFTLVELVLVIAIIGVTFTLVATRSGTFDLWKERDFERSFSETIVFLHHQAISDQSFYRLEIDFDQNTWQIGVMKNEEENNENLADLAADAGNLSLELAAFLSPSVGQTQSMIPPPGFPSLADPKKIPPRILFDDVRTMRGLATRTEGGKAYIMFSPVGFSEFAVIHLRYPGDKITTILVNPFTGLTEIFNEYKDFQWKYSGADQQKS